MDSPSKKKRRKSVSSAMECVMHNTNVTIADKKNIIPFSECYGIINRMIILRPLNRFPKGKLFITFSNQKENCKGNRNSQLNMNFRIF